MSTSASNGGSSAHLPEAIVEARKLTKVFYSDQLETHALSAVDLAVSKGEFLAITGPSGCGKSTLLSVLGMMERATSGQLVIAGQDVTQFGLKQLAMMRNRFVGFVFQDFNLIGDLNVLDNVALPLMYAGQSRQARSELALEVLERVGLTARANHFPNQLSGGQQQRTAVARAIVTQPAMLLADEPTGNLDSENGAAVMELIRDIHRAGTSVCLVTHDTAHVRFADRHLVMRDGQFSNSSDDPPDDSPGTNSDTNSDSSDDLSAKRSSTSSEPRG